MTKDEELQWIDRMAKFEDEHGQMPIIGVGPMTARSRRRPKNFKILSPEEQWAIDKELGILDWDGDPRK